VLIIVVLGCLMCLGVRESARVNNILVLVKLLVIGAFLLACAPHFDVANWHGHFIPPNTGKFGQFGWSGVLAGASVAFFAFIGFDALSTASQEVRDPRRSMPIGIIGSLLICTFLYMAVALVLTGVVPYDQLKGVDPIAIGIHATGNLWLETFVRLGALAGLTSVILVLLLGQSRILASMATDGLLWRKIGAVHPRFRTPYIATLFTMGFSSVIAACVPSDLLGDMVCIGTLFAFMIVCVGVLILRHTQPELDRPFKVPAVYLVAPLGVISCVLLVIGLSHVAQVRFVVWLGVGLIVYFVYGYHHSRVRRAGGLQ
jgi:APA family basic amino acid/polyamine antiporter